MAYTTINKSGDYFNTKLYTGNGGTQSITGVGFQPDWCWIKNRETATGHRVIDAVRGNTKTIYTNATQGEETVSNMITSFDSDGFSLGNDGGVNGNGNGTVSWNWKANGSGSANTDGSINSTVSANTTSGFSIVSYTGTGANATVGHGLGTTPSMIIAKNRSATGNWRVYHKSLGANYLIQLDLTGAALDNTTWNDTAPTSSVFSISSVADVNGSGNNIIAYCFAEKTGFSKFGSWTSNNNANGTFVYTGFAPSFVMLKEHDGTNQWVMYDNKRPSYNQTSNALFANGTSAEATDLGIDILSNGYKIRATNNQNTGNYIYMAFGQSLVGTNNIPCTAR